MALVAECITVEYRLQGLVARISHSENLTRREHRGKMKSCRSCPGPRSPSERYHLESICSSCDVSDIVSLCPSVEPEGLQRAAQISLHSSFALYCGIQYSRSQKVGIRPSSDPKSIERRTTSVNHPTSIFQLLGVYSSGWPRIGRMYKTTAISATCSRLC